MTRRLLLGYLALVALVLVVLVVPLGVTFQRRQVREATSAIERDAFVVASLAEESIERGLIDATVVATVRDYSASSGGRVVIVQPDGSLLLDTNSLTPSNENFSGRPEIQAAMRGEPVSGDRTSATLGGNLLYAAVPVASGGQVRGVVRVTSPSTRVDSRVRSYWLRLGLVSLVSLLAVALVGVVVARSVTNPLRRLEASAMALGGGDLSTRADPERGPPEVRSVAEAFNRTADRIEEVISSQEAFVADASHELRTPLTALRLRLENLSPELTPEGRAGLEDATEEVERLSRMVDGLLVLARAERATAPAQPCDLLPVVDSRVQMWQPFADERSVTLSCVLPGHPIQAQVDPGRLSQVLDNLIANALDVAPAGTSVTLRLGEGPSVVIHVVDQGSGLSEADRGRAFDRFWRADPVATGLGGSGLGLAIVDKLVRADGGTVRLDAAPGGGIDAVVAYPAAVR